MLVTLDQLETLAAVDSAGSFRRAAERLHKTPGAVGYQVRRAEEALGLGIFERAAGRGGSSLGSGGRHIMDRVHAILAQVEELEQFTRTLRDGWEPELRVVVDGALPMAAVLRCLKRFGEGDVPTPLRLEVAYQEGVLERFRAGADLALVVGLEEVGDSHRSWPLPPLQMVLVAAAEHALAGRDDVDQAARAGHVELVVRDNASKFDDRSRPSFLGSRKLVFLSDFHSKREALLAGAGFGWMPEHLVREDLESQRLVVLAGESGRWTYRPLVVAPKTRMRRAAGLFLETLLGD